MSSLSQLLALAALEEAPTVSFLWIKRAFGQVQPSGAAGGCSDDRFAEFLDDLIAGHGFPKPLPRPKWGRGVETGIHRQSRWLRAGVLDWLGDYLPPTTLALLDDAAEAAAAQDMDARAGNLQLVASNDRDPAA